VHPNPIFQQAYAFTRWKLQHLSKFHVFDAVFFR